MVEFNSDLVDEPDDDHAVNMLDALPPLDQAFYSREELVVELEGKSQTVAEEIEERFAFIGGSEAEWIRYLSRPDLPANMWRWGLADEVKAITGVSATPKKDGVRQRKLLMQCSANYCFSQPASRGELGLHRGGALSRLHVPGGTWEVASCDQNNAFARVITPRWMHDWCAAPPVRAISVWHALPPDFSSTISPATWTYPLYMRLAMGSSHSVYVLMAINLHVIGLTLLKHFNRSCHADWIDKAIEQVCSKVSSLSAGYDDDTPVSDQTWNTSIERLLCAPAVEGTLSPEQWARAVHGARTATTRVFTFVHVFSGPKRDDSLEQFLTEEADKRGLLVLSLCIDVERDPRWDLSSPHVALLLTRLEAEGRVDGIGGGPPCETWSKLRFLPNGPPPVRLRGRFA